MNRIKQFLKRIVFSLLDIELEKNNWTEVSDPLDPEKKIVFSTPTNRTVSRAHTLVDKEPGTVAWLNKELRKNDIFYDVGANIGIYSFFAANRLGKGKVISFEPHASNFSILIENIFLNQKGETIIPLNVALGDKNHIQDFHYKNIEPGSSGSQLLESPVVAMKELDKRVKIKELKSSFSLDRLVEDKVLKMPNLIKIDVDGNELNIVKGMVNILNSKKKPRSIQIEVDPFVKKKVISFMKKNGYKIDHIHYTKKGQRLIDEGNDPEAYPHNLVFVPST